MAFGGFFKKNKKKEDNKLTTLEQIRKAYEDLSDDDKKSFHQSIADRVHESIAAQERADGNEDSQSAEAREHEALGAEHADGKGAVEELHEKDDTKEEKAEDKRDDDDRLSAILSRLDALEAHFKSEGDSDKEAAEKAKEVYGLRGGVFVSDKKDDDKVTPKEAMEIARKLKV